MQTRRRWLAAPVIAAVVLIAGCQFGETRDYEAELGVLREEVRDKDQQIASQQAAINKLYKQLQIARGLSDDDMQRIFYPEQIVIDDLSGGEDYDGNPGDDGVTIYLKPVDGEGDVLKVAGDIRIELYDLENPTGQKLIGEYFVPVAKVKEYWYGKLFTYHYTIRCPWKKGVPQHDEITIRATFVDYLTKRVITAQKVVTVNPPVRG